MQPISQTSRADLLRWMRRCHTPAEKQLAAEILGYEWLEPQANVNLKITVSSGDQGDCKPESPDDESLSPHPEEDNEPAAITRPPEAFYALKHREQYADPDQPDDDLPECLRGVEPLSAADLRPLEQGEPLAHQPLVPQQRLLPFLRQALTYPLGQRLDVPRLVKQVARLQALQRIPRRPHVLPAGRVYVLLDLNKRLLPFWQDAHDLCELLARQHGKNGLDIRVLEDQPGGRYYDWFDQQQAVKAWQPLKVPSVVLIVSDMGQLSAQGSVVCQGWLRFAQQLARQGIRPLVLSPLSPAQQYAPFTTLVDQIPWGRLSRFKSQKPNQQQQEHSSHVQRVLSLLSVAVHVEPELLRAILGCLPAIQADSGVEAAVYLHPDVVWGYTAMTLRADKRAAYQALFRQEPASLQRQVLAVIRQHHIGQFPAVWAETVLNAKPLTVFTLDDAAWAEKFMVRFTRSFAGQGRHEGMAQFARRHLQRLGKDEAGNALYQATYASALYGLAYREALIAGEEVPALYDASVVQAVLSHQQDLKEYLVTQVGEYLYLAIDTGSTSEMLIGSLLGEMTSRLNVFGLSMDGKKTIVPVQTQTPLCHLIEAECIELDTGLERLHITRFTKPSWAHEIVRHREALDAVMYFAGERYRFQLTAGEGLLDRIYAGDYWEKTEGNDRVGFDSYGLYADLEIKGITQRFRWIEPGTFLMGSPPDEAGREPHESLKGAETQHHVTLTQGFWLADTTVTQALWQAVMGNNPSHFNGAVTIGDKSIYVDGANHPVEKVNWEDAQAFIAALNGMVADLGARLPTDAQWEYACRAGTSSVFSFGDNITPEQVNYDGNYPYANGKKGLYRQKTVPVKSLPANPWGLHEMHGNVWEWCQDWWQQEIPAEPVIDPEGLEAGVLRVVRGGSWNNGGRDVRSAFRYGNDPAERLSDLGFRLVLGLELRSGQGGGAATQERADDGDAGRRVAGDTADRGSVGSGGFAKPADKVLYSKEMMEFMESVRPQGGLSVDDLDKPTLAERVTEGLKGFTNLFRKKK